MTALLHEPKVKAREFTVSPEHKIPEKYEIIHGEIREVEPMSLFAREIAATLNERFIDWIRPKQLGRSRCELPCRIPLPEDRSRIRIPDLAYFSQDRWPSNRPIPFYGDPVDVVPDVAVEVISPNDDISAVLDKAYEYLRGGVRLVWVVLPKQRQVYVYQSPDAVRIVNESDTLDGGDVLPGFAVNVGSLFPPVEMNAPAS